MAEEGQKLCQARVGGPHPSVNGIPTFLMLRPQCPLHPGQPWTTNQAVPTGTFTFQAHADSVSTAQEPQQPPAWFFAPLYQMCSSQYPTDSKRRLRPGTSPPTPTGASGGGGQSPPSSYPCPHLSQLLPICLCLPYPNLQSVRTLPFQCYVCL